MEGDPEASDDPADYYGSVVLFHENHEKQI